MAAWEVWKPRRPRRQPRSFRWPINLSIIALNAILVRITLGTAVVGAAAWAQEHRWGLLNLLEPAQWIRIIATFLVLDFAIYVQHWALHRLPLLWRLHSMHHADLDYDWTTGSRFHPLEIFFSLAYKIASIVLIGADPQTVFLFEILLNASATFQHGNVYLPGPVDRALRTLVVTPDMHTVHHSMVRAETDSNFGFFLSFWDRLCGTYRSAPAKGFVDLDIGLPELRETNSVTFLKLLWMPFRR